MELDDIHTVGVVGAGTMGSGIAQVSATAGYDVVMQDVSEELVADGFDAIDESLGMLVERDELDAAAKDARRRIEGTTDTDALADCDIVVEAVTEELSVKQSVFGDLAAVTRSEAILATNTSTLSVTTIASAVENPARVVGLHFMNPVPVMAGVEVVVGEHTSEQTVALAHDFAAALEKETWEADDKPGFVVNRILMPWINEGVRAYDEGVASKADIDRGMRLGTNVPMGPLELADHIGLDVVLQTSETLHGELGDRYRPAYLVKRKVAAGDLGKKSGAGFYEYDD
jgi:3-hydroxybutyryl-CoA dehydrogenase